MANVSASNQSCNDSTEGKQLSYRPMEPALLGISNLVTSVALLLNVIHLAFLSKMPQGRRLRSRNFKVFLIYMAVVDILQMTIHILLDHEAMQSIISQEENRWACALTGTASLTLSAYHVTLILILGVERFITVMSPYFYVKYFKRKVYPWILGSFGIVLLALYGIVAAVFHRSAYAAVGIGPCRLSSPEYPALGKIPIGYGFSCFFLTILFLILMLGKGRLVLSGMSRRSVVSARYTKTMVITIALILAGQFICSIPIFASMILSLARIPSKAMGYMSIVSIHMLSLPTPIIYVAMDADYRSFISHTLSRKKIEPVSTPEDDGYPGQNVDMPTTDRVHVRRMNRDVSIIIEDLVK